MSDLLLSHPLFHQRLLRPEQLHRQLVVRRGEDVLQLVSHPIWFRFTWDWVPGQDWSDSGACLGIACFSFFLYNCSAFLCNSLSLPGCIYLDWFFLWCPVEGDVILLLWKMDLAKWKIENVHKCGHESPERTLLFGFSASHIVGGPPGTRGGGHIWKGKLLLATFHNQLWQPIPLDPAHTSFCVSQKWFCFTCFSSKSLVSLKGGRCKSMFSRVSPLSFMSCEPRVWCFPLIV